MRTVRKEFFAVQPRFRAWEKARLKAQFKFQGKEGGFHGAGVTDSRRRLCLRIPGGHRRGDHLREENEGDRRGREHRFRPLSFCGIVGSDGRDTWRKCGSASSATVSSAVPMTTIAWAGSDGSAPPLDGGSMM